MILFKQMLHLLVYLLQLVCMPHLTYVSILHFLLYLSELCVSSAFIYSQTLSFTEAFPDSPILVVSSQTFDFNDENDSWFSLPPHAYDGSPIFWICELMKLEFRPSLSIMFYWFDTMSQTSHYWVTHISGLV